MRGLAVAFATMMAGSFACRGSAPPADPQSAQPGPPPESEAPVALNPDVPIAYPAALFEQNIEGEVVLRLFTDSTGRLIPESTRVAESSNYPALDSAALAGSTRLRFAPAKRRGVPVATSFLQPVEFHHPGTNATSTTLSPPAAAQQAPRRAQPESTATATPTTTTPPPRPVVPRPRPDSTRPSPSAGDTTRHPADTTKPATDTTRSRPDGSGAAH